ncbi:MAG: hypothetical protein DMF42_10365 [Verrucomicrobia bacterium]|nr:MAG: hypothetical protein DMF42_10365 [Verrucomicrobiota bacterium]
MVDGKGAERSRFLRTGYFVNLDNHEVSWPQMLVPLQRVKASRLPAHRLCLRTILKLEVQSTNGYDA